MVPRSRLKVEGGTRWGRLPSMPRLLLRRHVALPQDHGAWAFLLSPLLIGLVAGGTWRVASAYLTVAALCAFLVRQPITRAVKALHGLAPRSDLPVAFIWFSIYAGVGMLHVAGLVLRGEGYVLWLAVPGIPVFAWYLWLVWHRRERRKRLMEIMGAGVLALSAPAACWVGGGAPSHEGWTLFGLAWGHTAFMIVLAYLRLQQRPWKHLPSAAQRLRAARVPLVMAAAELALVVALVVLHGLSWLLLLPYAGQLALALHDALRPAMGWMPRRIGLRLLLMTTLFTILFVVAWTIGVRT